MDWFLYERDLRHERVKRLVVTKLYDIILTCYINVLLWNH